MSSGLVPLLVLRCPEHQRSRRRVEAGPKGPRPGHGCTRCRTIWADGQGPDAGRGKRGTDPPGPVVGSA
ncbi:hypothetical protein [Frankia sp. CiP3]|uniref:hypothetical protein n=1 Tax=Frankia sp. CiP3 TaxID=2880971 RepID=UPI001EF54F2D|nr:hypothetical protein [Frankia sp. CiP3]